MKNEKGLTLIELVIMVVIFFMAVAVVSTSILNNMGATEGRAIEGAKQFISSNNLSVKRMTCAGDSDGDGYGSCAVTLSDSERINLRCPTDFVQTKFFGASSCKEVFTDLNLN